jgi:hypothetical protein
MAHFAQVYKHVASLPMVFHAAPTKMQIVALEDIAAVPLVSTALVDHVSDQKTLF